MCHYYPSRGATAWGYVLADSLDPWHYPCQPARQGKGRPQYKAAGRARNRAKKH